MSDTRPWLKLWKSVLADVKLTRLSLEDQARWMRLLVFVGINGERGQLHLEEGLTPLSSLFRTRVASHTRDALNRLPGIVLRDDDPPSRGLTITFTKWAKYQEDSSANRTRNWRSRSAQRDGAPASPTDVRVTVPEEKRRDTPLPPSSPPSQNHDRPDTPPEAFRLDCPDLRWLGRCVDPAWVRDHPGAHYPTVDRNGTPKQCPHHRAQPSSQA